MAQFDVRQAASGELVVDCQADLLDSLPTRYVIPLYRRSEADWVFSRLTPTLAFRGETYTLATPLGGAIDIEELGKPLGSLAYERYTILNAIDFLLAGV
jgi:toxin CcdB